GGGGGGGRTNGGRHRGAAAHGDGVGDVPPRAAALGAVWQRVRRQPLAGRAVGRGGRRPRPRRRRRRRLGLVLWPLCGVVGPPAVLRRLRRRMVGRADRAAAARVAGRRGGAAAQRAGRLCVRPAAACRGGRLRGVLPQAVAPAAVPVPTA